MESSEKKKKIIIAVVVLIILIIIVIAVVAKKDKKTTTKSDSLDKTELVNYRFLSSGNTWTYIVVDKNLESKMDFNGYSSFVTEPIIVSLKPTSVNSKQITAYANFLNKTGGYFVGDGTVPSGSVITAKFYTSPGAGYKSIIANVNGGVFLCTKTAGNFATTCVKYGTNPLYFDRMG